MGSFFWNTVGYRLLYNRYTMLVAAALSVSATWWALKPPAEERSALEKPLLDDVARRISEQTPAQLALKPIAVARLGGDTDGSITEGIRQRLAAKKARSVSNEFLDRVLRQIGMQDQPITRLDQALRVARETGVAGVLFGEVTEERASHGHGILRLDLRWAESSTGQAIFAGPIDAEAGGPVWSVSYWRLRILSTLPVPRILIWLAFALLLPIIGGPLIRRLTAHQSNAVNLAVLAAVTALDGVAAFCLLGFAVLSVSSGLLLLVSLCGAAYYNLVAVSWIDEYLG